MEIRLRVPGSTSNLGPGFDTLGLALTLYNRLTVRTTSAAGIRIAVQGMGAGLLPEGETNLFFRAAAAAAQRIGSPLPGLEVEMRNQIPLARGLGSSSTAIVAGVTAANHLFGAPLSESERLDLAAELEGHPDNVSACLRGGLTISSLSDGHVTCIRAFPPPELRAVVAIPHFELKTEAARAALPKEVSHREATFNVSHACLVTAALLCGDLHALQPGMIDRLHQPYRAPLIPGFEGVLKAAAEAGALGTCLSGAGPTLLAFATDGAERVKGAMVEAWRAVGIETEACVLQVDSDGVTVE